MSKDGTSAEAVAVITGPQPNRLPYEVLAKMIEDKKKEEEAKAKDNDDSSITSSMELDAMLNAKV